MPSLVWAEGLPVWWAVRASGYPLSLLWGRWRARTWGECPLGKLLLVYCVLSGYDFRQALVDHYSTLSAEAARREQKALWKIQRHRLENARLRFLLEDQKLIQVSRV